MCREPSIPGTRRRKIQRKKFCAILGEPPDADPHVRWCERERLAAAPYSIAEGFAIAEGGLLKNPETGKNVLAMNPEADWERVREGIIGGLWQANMDWYQYTGQGSDALNYSTKEEFGMVYQASVWG